MTKHVPDKSPKRTSSRLRRSILFSLSSFIDETPSRNGQRLPTSRETRPVSKTPPPFFLKTRLVAFYKETTRPPVPRPSRFFHVYTTNARAPCPGVHESAVRTENVNLRSGPPCAMVSYRRLPREVSIRLGNDRSYLLRTFCVEWKCGYKLSRCN